MLFALCVLWIVTSSCLGLTSASSRGDDYPSLLASLGIDGAISFCSEEVPVANQDVKERLEKELLLTLWDRPQVILWLKRSRRYLPYIEDILKKNGMPDDLKYIALAESALRPHATSAKGAVGFWQFMKDTGVKYGLLIDDYVDERRNLFASTAAAVRYLKDLYARFGSWTLAAAAFNVGEEGLAAAIKEQGVNNYYLLYLPMETQRYLFRLISIKLIFSNPKRYGFHLSDEDYYPPLEFERVELTCATETHLRSIAEAARTHLKAIKDLNPEIRGYYLRPGRHIVLIPQGASKGFEQRLRSLLKDQPAVRHSSTYLVKDGDTLSSVAARLGIPLSTLMSWNHLKKGAHIRPGDQLIIYIQQQEMELSDMDEGKGGSPIND